MYPFGKELIENIWKALKGDRATFCLAHLKQANQIPWLPVEALDNSTRLSIGAVGGTWHRPHGELRWVLVFRWTTKASQKWRKASSLLGNNSIHTLAPVGYKP